MSYFATRPRSYSKPTKDELKIFSQQLSQYSEHELRRIIELAVSDSTETARVIARILSNPIGALNKPQFAFQPVQPQQSLEEHDLPTPSDSAGDSEMSGTENVSQLHQGCYASPRRSTKRKSLADRDDNVPSFSPRSFATMKKRRAEGQEISQLADDKINCGNCGRNVPSSCWNQFETCVYHPGTFEKMDAVLSAGFNANWKGQWSCCRSSLTGRGCIQSRHRSVDASGIGREAFAYVAKVQETQFYNLFRSGRLPLLQ